MSSSARVAETGDSAGTLMPLLPLLVGTDSYHCIREGLISLLHGDEERAVTWLARITDQADIKFLYSVLGDLMGKLIAAGSIREAEKLLWVEGAGTEGTISNEDQNVGGI